ncbi:hypothetical protein [Ornithinibacillus scapharcae]|uniref:hypothetical protein n=1 Tax=Ornithinibacillus scapharcae TaxID=1147159 RepID=UPI000225B0CA|nr:hypothetical protein [Ornithinibacillus scapharcae]
MSNYFLAVTYDICVHNDLFEDMNEYPLESAANLVDQVRKFAKQDVAPLVKVFESTSSDFTGELKLYKEFRFKDYECKCAK